MKLVCFIRIAQLFLVMAIILRGSDEVPSQNRFGVYTQVYPDIDTTRDQTNCSRSSNETCPLYIALMMSFGGDYITSGVIPGVQLALDQINSDPDILPGYTLHYTLLPTRCETFGTAALDALYTQLLQPPTKVGIIGSGCSLATEATAQVSHYYNLTHVSCVSSSAKLGNRTRFPNYIQLLTSNDELTYGFYGIIKRFGWRRMAIILQEESLFESTTTKLMELFERSQEDMDIDIKIERFQTLEGTSELGDQPFDPDYRIVLFAMYSNHARRLLCEASKRGIGYPRHLFLFYGWYNHRWWIGDEEEEALLERLYNGSCTIEQREAVIGRTLTPQVDRFISNCTLTVDSGKNGYVFQNGYEDRFYQSQMPPLNLKHQSQYAQHCYDATWTLARALDLTSRDIDSDTSLRRSLLNYEPDILDMSSDDFNLEHFSYANSGVLDLIFGHLKATNLTGITGSRTGEVFFNPSDGLRVTEGSHMYQYRPSYTPEQGVCSSLHLSKHRLTIKRELVGIVNDSDDLFTLLVDEDTLFPDGVPYDGVPKQNIIKTHPAIVAIINILAVVGIAFSITCMVFNFVFRKKRLIRLSSPNLNYLIVSGAILLYVDMSIFVISSDHRLTVTFSCNMVPWLTAIGFSLCFGTIIVKMYRIYYIIRNLFNPTNPTLKDKYLAIVVSIFVLIDIVVLGTYSIVNGIRGELGATLVSDQGNPTSEIGITGVILENYFYSCSSFGETITLGILNGYKIILEVIALAFTFSIGKMKLKGLNDAKFIAISIYITTFIIAIDTVGFYAFRQHLFVLSFLFPISIFVGATVVLALVFVPNMIFLYRDPQGKKMFSKQSFEASVGRSISLHQRNAVKKSKNSTEVEMLRKRIRELESLLVQSTSQDRRSSVTQSFGLCYSKYQEESVGRSVVETDIETYLPRDSEEEKAEPVEEDSTEQMAQPKGECVVAHSNASREMENNGEVAASCSQ